MKLELKTVVFLFCLLQITNCVPIKDQNEKLTDESVTESEDPCDLDEIEKLSEDEKNLKIKNICEQGTNCSFCGNSTEPEEGPLEVEPEIVAPIFDGSNGELDELRAPTQKLIERNIIIENDNETQYYRGFIESGANITTIIRLTNLIKNENIINMPTTLNNTNINNIHIYHNKTSAEGGKFGLGYNEDGPCCFQVEPKKCKQSTAGAKCSHKKKKVCGVQCTSKIIHHNKKTECSYTPQWPYVICPNQQPQPGYYPPPQFYPPPNVGFYPGFNPPQIPNSIDEFDDDEDLPLFPDDDLLNNPESGWIVGPEKCKIVSEDGLQIFNCTNKGYEFEHPYARNTASESIKREARHAIHPQQQQYQHQQQHHNQAIPQMPYYPVFYQPVQFVPVPYFYPPQYYSQQPPAMNYYQQPQIPQPPIERDSFSENKEAHENNAYHKRRQSRKHNPIVMDDDEL